MGAGVLREKLIARQHHHMQASANHLSSENLRRHRRRRNNRRRKQLPERVAAPSHQEQMRRPAFVIALLSVKLVPLTSEAIRRLYRMLRVYYIRTTMYMDIINRMSK